MFFYVLLGSICFIAAIAVLALLVMQRDARLWDTRVLGALTVQIMPDGETPPPSEIAAAMSILKATPAVASATLLSADENRRLLAPWNKDIGDFADLPFPALIDVRLAPGARPDMAQLRNRLHALAPHAIVDDHTRLLSQSGVALNPASWIAGSALLVCLFAFVLSFAAVTRAQLSVMHEELDLLRLLGASNRRVARLFMRRSLAGVLAAAIIGTGFGGALAYAAANPHAFGIVSAPVVAPIASGQLVWLALIPAAAAIMALVVTLLLIKPPAPT